MDKSQLCRRMGKQLKMNEDDVQKVIDLFMGNVGLALRKGQKVHLRGFGTFLPVRRAAHRIGLFAKGRTMKLKARTVPVFHPHKDLKAYVAEGNPK